MKNFISRILKFLLVAFLIIAAYNYKLIVYGARQLKGQLTIIWNSKPVEEVLKNQNLQSEQRKKLLLIGSIRQFAMDSLGLKNSKNYTTYYNQYDKPIMWVVTGCLPYELKAKEWWFPFIGTVSYKGFFNEQLATKEAQIISREGYESDIYSPSAWSTLGYFNDPIFSNMLKRSSGRLSELIIHELTHATVYLESNVDFNENLATFIGEKGAEQFLISNYGKNSDTYKKYHNFLADEKIYSEYMMKASNKLDSLYKSFDKNLADKEKATKKYRKIASIMSGLKLLPFAYPERYTFDFKKTPLPGNTEFMAFLRYREKQDTFSDVFYKRYNGNLKEFIADIVNKTANNEPLPF